MTEEGRSLGGRGGGAQARASSFDFACGRATLRMTEERRSLGGRGGGALGPRAIPIFPSRAEPFFCYPAPASLSPLARRRDWAKRFPRERDLGGGKESSTFERWGLKEQPARAHPLFLIPLPHRGRGSRRRPERSASGAEGRGGAHPEARGGASSPPHPSLSPKGRGRQERAPRGDYRGTRDRAEPV